MKGRKSQNFSEKAIKTSNLMVPKREDAKRVAKQKARKNALI